MYLSDKIVLLLSVVSPIVGNRYLLIGNAICEIYDYSRLYVLCSNFTGEDNHPQDYTKLM